MSEEKKVVAEPAALGLFGLAMATFVVGAFQMGGASAASLVLPWALVLGGVTQRVAGVMDFKNKNIFGATAFSAYGVFWISVAIVWVIELWGNVVIDPRALGWAFAGYLVFTLYMTIGSATINKVLFTIFVMIDLLFVALVLHTFSGIPVWVPGILNFLLGLLSFYASAGVMLNTHTGRKVLPLGSPFLFGEKAQEAIPYRRRLSNERKSEYFETIPGIRGKSTSKKGRVRQAL
jgi:hypothetical protein